METVYDWITILIFAGLITRFLSQSTKPEVTGDSLGHYLIASVGCAFANWLGNKGLGWAAGAMIAVVVAYIFYFLRSPSGSPPHA